jgi:hypothetical protein
LANECAAARRAVAARRKPHRGISRNSSSGISRCKTSKIVRDILNLRVAIRALNAFI